MHKQDRLTEGMHGVARILLAATILALTIGSVGQPVLAQGFTGIVTFVETSTPPEICVHHVGIIQVWLTRQLPNISLDKDGNAIEGPGVIQINRGAGIKITAEVADPGIAELEQNPPNALTGEWDFLPQKAQFDLRGKKAGTTTVIFRAKPSTFEGEGLEAERGSPSGETNFRISVKVKDCYYKVTGIFKWRDVAGYSLIVAATDALIEPDADGDFTVKASSTFTGYETCITQGLVGFNFANPKVDLTGNVNDSGNVIVKMTFPPVGISSATTCKGAKVPDLTGNVAPLIVTVPSSGVSPKQSSVLSVSGFKANGSATVYVLPVDPNSGQ